MPEAGGRITVKAYKESAVNSGSRRQRSGTLPEELGKITEALHGRQIQKPPGGRSRT